MVKLNAIRWSSKSDYPSSPLYLAFTKPNCRLMMRNGCSTATALPQTTTLHLVWNGLIWQLVSLTNACDYYNQYLSTEELCFDAERQHYWRLRAGPEPTASPVLLEQTLTNLHQRHQQGRVALLSDPLPSTASAGI